MSQKINEQIREAIDRMHDRGSGDFQTLIRQIESKQRQIQLNIPQYAVALAKAPTLFIEWGRGTGKTTIRGYRWSQIIRHLPRSTGLFIGPSYQFILSRIVPSLVQGLEMFGIYKDLHYFIGKRPPRSWRRYWGKAYQPPEDYRWYITFWNGVGVHLISHDVKGDGRGINSDWLDGDEAALLKPDQLQENSYPTLRGTNARKFQGLPFFGSKFFSSSTPLTPEGMWMIEYEDKARMDPAKFGYIKATCEWNMHNLRKGYLTEAEQDAYAFWVFLAEYKNRRPRFTKDGFYAMLDIEKHGYYAFRPSHYTTYTNDCRKDGDLVKGQPLILGIDWGASINCLTANQHLLSLKEYRTLKSMYVLGAEQKIQEDLFTNFHNYYRPHQGSNRDLFLHYDNTGNNETGFTKRTRAQQAIKQLRGLGWNPIPMTQGGTNPMHGEKYIIWENILSERDPRYPTYRFNRDNCPELYLSMRNAKTKPGRNGEIKKDKSSETSSSILRQHATDLSDANDTPIHNIFKDVHRFGGQLLPSNR